MPKNPKKTSEKKPKKTGGKSKKEGKKGPKKGSKDAELTPPKLITLESIRALRVAFPKSMTHENGVSATNSRMGKALKAIVIVACGWSSIETTKTLSRVGQELNLQIQTLYKEPELTAQQLRKILTSPKSVAVIRRHYPGTLSEYGVKELLFVADLALGKISQTA